MLRLIPFAVLLLAVPTVAAQDAIDRLTDALALSDEQVEIVEDVYRADDPGMGWTLAAALAPTLTEAQRATLLAPPERPAGARAGGRGQGRGGAGRGQGRRGGRSDADRAVAKAARDAALGLDATQSAALDAAQGEGRPERGADPVTPAVADVLDAAQEDLVRLQRGILITAFRGARGGRRGGASR